MKYTYLLIALLLLGSCGNQNEPEEAVVDSNATELETTQTEEVTIDKLLGKWTFEDTKMQVTQEITYNEDGTYQMNMAGMNINGTWQLTEDVLITKSRPDAPGQKKTITKLTQDSLCTFWEPAGGTGRQMNYVRAN